MYYIKTINNKNYYSHKKPILLENGEEVEYDNYNLDIYPLYVVEIDKYNNNCLDEIVFHTDILQLQPNSMLYTTIKYEKDLSFAMFRNPLAMFVYPELLMNHDDLFQVLHNYPEMIFTFLKEKYRRYIPIDDIVQFLIEHKLYPTQNMTLELLYYLENNIDYMYQYTLYLIKTSYFQHASPYDDNYCIIRDYIKKNLNQKEFVKVLFSKIKTSFFLETSFNFLRLQFDFYQSDDFYSIYFDRKSELDKREKTKLNDLDNKIYTICHSSLQDIDYDYLVSLLIEKYNLQKSNNPKTTILDVFENIDTSIVSSYHFLKAFSLEGFPVFSLLHSNFNSLTDEELFEIVYIQLDRDNNQHHYDYIPQSYFKYKDKFLKLYNVKHSHELFKKIDTELLNSLEFLEEFLLMYPYSIEPLILKTILNHKDYWPTLISIDPSLSTILDMPKEIDLK